MTTRWPLRLITILFVAVLTVGCGSRLPFDVSLAPTLVPEAAPSDELTLASFAHSVSESGAAVALRGGVKQPFFAVDGQVVDIEGEPVQVYEYQGVDEARMAANTVTADGSAIAAGDNTTLVDWISTPHFYQRDRLIVVYVGEQDAVLNVLDGTLGAAFAGAAAYPGAMRTAQ